MKITAYFLVLFFFSGCLGKELKSNYASSEKGRGILVKETEGVGSGIKYVEPTVESTNSRGVYSLMSFDVVNEASAGYLYYRAAGICKTQGKSYPWMSVQRKYKLPSGLLSYLLVFSCVDSTYILSRHWETLSKEKVSSTSPDAIKTIVFNDEQVEFVPADDLQPGDVLVSINGVRVTSTAMMTSAIAKTPEYRVPIAKIRRKNSVKTIELSVFDVSLLLFMRIYATVKEFCDFSGTVDEFCTEMGPWFKVPFESKARLHRPPANDLIENGRTEYN